VELLKVHFAKQEALVSHANAALTPRARLRVARLVVDQHVPIAEVAARFQCSWPTVKRWADRYAAGEPMTDRSSRPHWMPAKTCPAMTRRIVALRLRKRLGPVQLGALTGVAPSTAHRVLVRCRLNRLSHVDRATGEPVRRYEHPYPGSMIHVDVTKFGNIPDGGGWRYVGPQQGKRNKATTALRTGRTAKGHPNIGTAYLHTVIDDHSRIAYVEICADEKAATAIGVLQRATAWFAARGVTVERVLSDNGSAYRSFAWADACAELGITHKRTRPYRPQTNGKIERFHRTLADGWGYARCYTSESERREALPAWIHEYNHHRPHTACGNKPPITRLTNLSGQYT
jgi:transposase InsO family protein